MTERLHQAITHCIQGPTLGEMRAVLTSVNESVAEIKQNQKELVQVVRDIAEQGAHLKALDTRVEKNEKDTDTLFSRVRGIELKSGDSAKQYMQVLLAAFISACVTGFIHYLLKP